MFFAKTHTKIGLFFKRDLIFVRTYEKCHVSVGILSYTCLGRCSKGFKVGVQGQKLGI